VPRSKMNAHAERYARTIRSAVTDGMRILGECHLSMTVTSTQERWFFGIRSPSTFRALY
jgi:hypothetical protein